MLRVYVNGISLAYEQLGRGRPLVLLHGYPLDHSTMEKLIPFLENDFELILPDLRGFGKTQSVRKDFTMADCAADVAGLLDQLNIVKTAVAGHSMGGYVALAFMRAYPERVLGLGLVSSQTLADTPEKKAGRYQEAEAILSNGVKEVAESMPEKLTDNPDLQVWLKELILHQRPEGLAGALRAMAERPDLTPQLVGSNMPLVLVHGMVDALVPIERARSAKAVLSGAHLTEIPNAGHMTMMEAPEKTAEALRVLK